MRVDREVVSHDGKEAIHADRAAVGRHVHGDHLHAQSLGQQLGEVGLAGAGRAGEHDAGDRLLVSPPAAVADARQAHDAVERLVLPDEPRPDLPPQFLQHGEILLDDPVRHLGGLHRGGLERGFVHHEPAVLRHRFLHHRDEFLEHRERALRFRFVGLVVADDPLDVIDVRLRQLQLGDVGAGIVEQDAVDVVVPVFRQEDGVAEGVDDVVVVGAHARVVEVVDERDAAHLAALDVRGEQGLHPGGGAVRRAQPDHRAEVGNVEDDVLAQRRLADFLLPIFLNLAKQRVALDDLRQVNLEMGELGQGGITTHGQAGEKVAVGRRGVTDDQHRLVAVVGGDDILDALGQVRENGQPVHDPGRFLPLRADVVFARWVVKDEAGLAQRLKARCCPHGCGNQGRDGRGDEDTKAVF